MGGQSSCLYGPCEDKSTELVWRYHFRTSFSCIGEWFLASHIMVPAFMHFACFGSRGSAAKALSSCPWSMADANINLGVNPGKLSRI